MFLFFLCVILKTHSSLSNQPKIIRLYLSSIRLSRENQYQGRFYLPWYECSIFWQCIFFGVTDKTTNYILEHTLHTELNAVCTIIIVTAFATASYVNEFVYFVSEDDLVDYLSITATACVATVFLYHIFWVQIYQLIAIVSFTIQTFDLILVYVKMYNLIVWITSGYFVLTGPIPEIAQYL